MLVVETPVFAGLVRKHLDDDHYRALQIALLLRPEQGALIAGSGGLRNGTSALSFGTAGCNLTCGFCQNWDISKSATKSLKDARLRDLHLLDGKDRH